MKLPIILLFGFLSIVFAVPPVANPPVDNPLAPPPPPNALAPNPPSPAPLAPSPITPTPITPGPPPPAHAPYRNPPHIKGVIYEIFERASFEKKKEALKFEFQERKAIQKARQEFRDRIEALELEKKLLEIDLQEAQNIGDENRINTALNAIAQQEYKITQERNIERSDIGELESNMIMKINGILGY